MKKICLFPGTFDPVTLGHADLIRRALPAFDHLVIGIGANSGKAPMFPAEQRLGWLRRMFDGEPRISVDVYNGLTVNYCKEIGASFMLRGLRSVSDFDYEKAIAEMNRRLAPEVETIFLPCDASLSGISSTLVRDVYRNGGDISQCVPALVLQDLKG